MHISFEVEQEIVPKLMEGPERVQVTEGIITSFVLGSALSDISSSELNLSMSGKNGSLSISEAPTPRFNITSFS